jgi:hypothetical protein
MSWMAMTAPVCHQLEAGFQQAFFGERVADLNGRALFLDGVVELGRGHGRAADAVAAGLGAEIDHRQADALGFGVEDLVGFGDACGKGVDQACCRCSADRIRPRRRRSARRRVAVAADTGDDAGDQVAGLGMVGRRSAARSSRRRARAHGEDVAQDAADAGRRALVGLDVGGVVVAFHLEDDASPSPISTTPAFSPGPWITLRAGGRQGLSHFFEDL